MPSSIPLQRSLPNGLGGLQRSAALPTGSHTWHCLWGPKVHMETECQLALCSPQHHHGMSESQLEEVLLFLLPFLCFLLKFSRFSYLPVQSCPLLMSCRPLQMSTSPLAQLPASSHSRMNEMGTIPVGGPGVQQCFACMNSSQSASRSSCEVPVGFPPTLSAYLWF